MRETVLAEYGIAAENTGIGIELEGEVDIDPSRFVCE